MKLTGFLRHLMPATKADIDELEELIMTYKEAFDKFVASQTAFNSRNGTAIDGLVTSLAGVTQDVQGLKDTIAELQNSVGEVTPEDQALIDKLQTDTEAVSTKLESTNAALSELDSATPPKVPVPTPTP